MQDKPALAKRIGNRVKQFRIESGLTQKRLAEATGLSPALLSRIENGYTMPSIPTLEIISNTLKTEIGYFFRDEDYDGFIITHPNRRHTLLSRSESYKTPAYELELLAEGMKNPFMEPAIVTYVGKDEEVELRTHDGQEFIYVLGGKVKLTLGTKEFFLKKGNAAYWNGNVPHKAVKVGKRPAMSLHVHLIPGRWSGTFRYDDLPAQRNRVKRKK